MQNDNKITHVAIITYTPLSHVKTVLENHLSQIKAYSYILHDGDSDKVPHIHILICSKQSLHLQTYINWFKYIDSNGEKVNTLGQPCKDIDYYYQYLIHANDPDKFQYPAESRVTYNTDFFEVADKKDKSIMALTDILSGCSLRHCALTYGRDFIYHYGHFKQLINDIEVQEGISLLNIKK